MANILFLVFFHTAASLTAPVIIVDTFAVLDRGYVSNNPFYDLSSNAFKEIVHDIVRLSTKVLIILEENFSVEDLSRKDAKGGPYRFMHQSFLEEKVMYLPSVVDPFMTLQEMLPATDPHEIYINNSVQPFEKSLKYYYLYFTEQEQNSNRIEVLRRHDALIKDAYDEICSEYNGPIMIIYTGKQNPMATVGVKGYLAPKAEQTEIGDTIMHASDKALIMLIGITQQRSSLRTQVYPLAAQSHTFPRERMAVRVKFGQLDIDFNIENYPASWLLDSVVLLEGDEEVGRSDLRVGVPAGCSYFCAEPLVIVNTRDGSYVNIEKYQLEPLNRKRMGRQDGSDLVGGLEGESTEATQATEATGASQATGATEATTGTAKDASTADLQNKFSERVTCGRHFTSRILTGLFVATIVICITMTGIAMMYGCRSNSLMDDPDQKPLMIIAQI